MTISYTIDLSKYSDNQVAMLMVDQVITREEFEQWKRNKTGKVLVTAPEALNSSSPNQHSLSE